MTLTGAQEAEIRARTGGYLHAEAYCLMTYECVKCGQREQIWNSRDGITPFFIRCAKCDGEAKHVEAQRLDRRYRDFKPQAGVRIFIDMPYAQAFDIALRRYEQMLQRQYPCDDMPKDQFLRMILEGVKPGDPALVLVSATAEEVG